jgi:hypothetical protein
VTSETARLLQHWRHHEFTGIRPFFCQVEAVETIIWLTEVAPQLGNEGKVFLDHLDEVNSDASAGLPRLALKLATGAGKTTVMAMVIAWQTINAVRRPSSSRFTRGFLVVTVPSAALGPCLSTQLANRLRRDEPLQGLHFQGSQMSLHAQPRRQNSVWCRLCSATQKTR